MDFLASLAGTIDPEEGEDDEVEEEESEKKPEVKEPDFDPDEIMFK